MTIKLSRSNGTYNATIHNPGTGFQRNGCFNSRADAIDAIRRWQHQANNP